jgi:hypothetical protein
MLDTLHLDDAVVENSTYLKSIGYDNAFNEGDPLLIREKKAEAKAEAKAEVEEVEQYQPITIKDIIHDRFSKDNAMDYEEDEKESDSGRISTYISSMTMRTTDDEGNTNGALVKRTDEDGNVSWMAEDVDGNELSEEDFDTKDEAKQAIADAWNKEQKKEFDKEAKKAAKEKQKAKEKAAKETAKAAPKAPSIDVVAQNAGISPKNIRDLYKVNRELFSLNKVKALASAVAMDRMIGVMAKRAGVTKAEMYGKLKFEKASEQDLPQGVKMQVDAWHGSPYEFDKFQTAFMGKGEGAQAFGWGLYFTDLNGIAREYAESLAKQKQSYLYKGNVVFGDGMYKRKPDESLEYQIAAQIISDSGTVSEFAFNKAKERLKDYFKSDQNEAAISKLENIKFSDFSQQAPSKNLYKVSLHKGKTPDKYTWLEWDKPVSNEVKEKVKEELTKLGISTVRDGYTRTSYFNGEKVEEDIPTKDALDDKFTGKQLYEFIALSFNGKLNEIQEQASLLLLRGGVDGVKYPAESISRGATSETTRGFNYVVFDENAVSIEEAIKFQKDAEKARGAMMITLDGQATIYALTDPNVSTPLHELAHVFEHYLTDGEKKAVMDAAKTKEWNTETSEYFARGFEKYLAEGKSPIAALDKIFAKFKEWLTDIYNGISGSDIDIELNEKMRKIYAQMLGEEIVNKRTSKKAPSIFTDLDATNKRGGLKAQQEAKKSFKEKYGKAADVAKAISANFEAIADELKSKDVFTEIDCK